MHVFFSHDNHETGLWLFCDLFRFNLGLNTSKIADYIKKSCGQKFSKLAHDRRIFYAIGADFDADRRKNPTILRQF